MILNLNDFKLKQKEALEKFKLKQKEALEKFKLKQKQKKINKRKIKGGTLTQQDIDTISDFIIAEYIFNNFDLLSSTYKTLTKIYIICKIDNIYNLIEKNKILEEELKRLKEDIHFKSESKASNENYINRIKDENVKTEIDKKYIINKTEGENKIIQTFLDQNKKDLEEINIKIKFNKEKINNIKSNADSVFNDQYYSNYLNKYYYNFLKINKRLKSYFIDSNYIKEIFSNKTNYNDINFINNKIESILEKIPDYYKIYSDYYIYIIINRFLANFFVSIIEINLDKIDSDNKDKLSTYMIKRLDTFKPKNTSLIEIIKLYKQQYDNIRLTFPIGKSKRDIYDDFLTELYKDKSTLEIFDIFIKQSEGRNEAIDQYISSLISVNAQK